MPEVLALLQDMTRYPPAVRLSAAEAHSRMLTAQRTVAPEVKAMELPMSLLDRYDVVPRRKLVYVYGYSPY